MSPTVRASGWMCAYFQWWHMPSMKNRVESSGRDCIRITARFLGGYARCADLFGWPMKPDRPGSGWPGLADAQIECVVAAPSKLIRPAGDRVKTDARDAAHLTRLLRLGELTAVTVPDAEVEAVRDLVRAREDARGSDAGAASTVQTAAAPRLGIFRVGRLGAVSTNCGCAVNVSTTPTPPRRSITTSMQSSRRPLLGTASTSRS